MKIIELKKRNSLLNAYLTQRVGHSGNKTKDGWNNQKTKSNGREELGIAHCNLWDRLLGRGITKCDLCGEENYRRIRRPFVEVFVKAK